MNFSALIQSSEELAHLDSSVIKEVIVPCNGLAREGGPNPDEARNIIEQSKAMGYETVLLADRLVEERNFRQITALLEGWAKITTLRVQDTGIAHWLKEQGFTFQLSLETGNSNTIGIEGWLEMLAPAVSRVILNNQIPREHLLPILSGIKIDTEILGLGPILMYYTPRKLLSFQGIENDKIEATSEETGTKTFRFRESSAGTVMYFSKELCLLSYLEELNAAGLNWMRLDLRDLKKELITEALQAAQSGEILSLKEHWPYALLAGYYKTNKSDSIFKHLPKRRKEEDQIAVAEVLDISENQVLVRILEPVTTGTTVSAINTKGKTSTWAIENFAHLDGKSAFHAGENEIVRIPKVAKFLCGTYLYKTDEN
jgi:putative protease